MTAIANNPLIESLAIGAETAPKSEQDGNAMVQEDFFKLMIAQMKNQDPNKPLDPNEYLSQLTNFSMVDGIQAMNRGFEALAGSLRSLQTLQGATMVGREVLVDGERSFFDGSTALSGTVTVDEPVEGLRVGVYDASGSLVAQLPLEAGGEEVPFSWDGRDTAGEVLAAGLYTVRAEGRSGEQTMALATRVRSRVESVTLDPSGGGLVLNLAGLGARNIDAVQAVY